MAPTNAMMNGLGQSVEMMQDDQLQIHDVLPTFFCRAIFYYQSQDESSLSFCRGDIIEVLTQTKSGWWDGMLGDVRGWFPSNYVRPITDDEAEVEFELTCDRQDHDRPTDVHKSGTNAGDANIFWIPQVTGSGQVYYLNTLTGKRAWEIPSAFDELSSDGGRDIGESTSHSRTTSRDDRTGSSAAMNVTSSRFDSTMASSLVANIADAELQLVNTILHKLSYLNVKGQIRNLTRVKALGASCDVYTGDLEDEIRCIKVAVKKLRIFWDTETSLAKSLVKEAYIWSKVQHRNILPLLGFFLDDDDYPHLVSMWMAKGTLFDYLKCLEPGEETTGMAGGIAAGLAYLHEQNIVHADLKSPNILISDSGHPLITDFGVSLLMAASVTMMCGTTAKSVRGTVRWTTIELFMPEDGKMDSATATTHSDVWAFGMVVYELLSRKLPYADYKTDGQVISAIIKGILPQIPFNHVLWDVCQKCWMGDSKQRPPMAVIRRLIRELDVLETRRSHSLIDSYM